MANNNAYTLRSGVEKKLADYLNKEKIEFRYEDTLFEYNIPESKHKYTLDFTIKKNNGGCLNIETKGVYRGRWPVADRKKHLYIREANPKADIRFVFQNANAKIAPNAKMTVSKWAADNGFKWTTIDNLETLEKWLDE